MAKYKAKVNTNPLLALEVTYDLFTKSKMRLEDDTAEVTVLTSIGTYTEAALLADKERLKDIIADINDKLAAIELVKPV